MGTLVLIGWMVDSTLLKSIVPGFVTMKANTAIGLVLTGVAALFTRGGEPRRRWTGMVCALLVLVIALLTLLQMARGIDLGIDQLLFEEPDAINPGRMGAITALVFGQLSSALLLCFAGRAVLLAQGCTILALILAGLCSVSYLYTVDSVPVAPFSMVALHTSLTLTLLSAGVLASLLTDKQLIFLTSDATSSVLIRRLLPAAILVPVVMGLLGLAGQEAGWYGSEVNMALITVVKMVVLAAVVLWGARKVASLEAERELSNRALKASEEKLRQLNADLERQIHERTYALQQSEQRFRSAFEFAPIGIALVSTDGRWLRVNRALCEILGYGEQELLNTPFRSITHPDDLECGADYTRMCRSGEISNYQIEKRYLHKLGYPVSILLQVSSVRDADGVPLYFIAQLQDITQRKVAEREMSARDALLRQFIKHSPAAIAMFDRDLRYIHASDRWLVDFGLTGIDVSGLHHYEVFPDIPQRWREIHQRALAGTVEYCEEDPFVRADGSVLWLHWECRPWRRANDEIGGLIMFTQVITERKRAEEQIKASLREKEVLLKEIHHRVKNNLQIVSALLDLQSEHTSNPQALEMFRESRNRVKSMALIHERLYRSQDMGRVNFSDYVRQLVDDLCQSCRISDNEISLDLDVGVTPLPLDAAIPCGLLLNELITNCFKHAFNGRDRGNIRVALHVGDDGRAVLTVADDGIGFPAGIDFRDTASFGMQLVNTLVEQLNGEISLQTEPGTSFTIRFTINRK